MSVQHLSRQVVFARTVAEEQAHYLPAPSAVTSRRASARRKVAALAHTPRLHNLHNTQSPEMSGFPTRLLYRCAILTVSQSGNYLVAQFS